MQALFLESVGAVTPVGLTAPSTCAAVRAGISRIAEAVLVPPPGEPILGARVQAGRSLRGSPRDWFLNLASKALRECADGLTPSGEAIPIFVCVPEGFRQHPALESLSFRGFLGILAKQTGLAIDLKGSKVLFLGAAGLPTALTLARQGLEREGVSRCIVGGVDSLINDRDIARLGRVGRLHGPGNSQGVIPGEAAAFLSLSLTGRESGCVPLGTLVGFAADVEPNPVGGSKYSNGEGLGRAVRAALSSARVTEPEISFVVSNNNGERYAAWESVFSHARTYRTRRERLPLVYPATSVGDTGAASSTLGVLVAAMATARGHAPGEIAVCEARSESDQRSACVVRGSPSPPYASLRERARS